MNESTDPTLHERLADLEAQVAALHDQVERLNHRLDAARPAAASAQPVEAPASEPGPEAVRPAPSASKQTRREAAPRVRSVLKSEDWLNKLGIALLLFGLAFLFKLGIDRGWLTPTVRIAFGLVLGVFLLGAGLRLRPRRTRLGQVLLGGGIATFYVTLFAAYQFYGLFSYPVAFGGMAVATFIGFGLAVRQHDAVLSVIATVGGLGTPFLLYTGEGNIPGLVFYTCVILSSAAGIYLYKGWRSLLWTSVCGGWLVLLVPWFDLIFNASGGPLPDRGAVQAGVVFGWLAFGVLPVVREVWHHQEPERWTMPPSFFKKLDVLEYPASLLTVVTPLVTLGLSRSLWHFSDVLWGLILVGAVALYAVAYLQLHQGGLLRLASAHGMAAAILLAISWFELFGESSMTLLALTLEVGALHVLARSLGDRVLRFTGHVGFVMIAWWMAYRLLDLGGSVPVLVNGRALMDLAVLAIVFGAAWTLRGTQVFIAYALSAYVGLMAWFWRDLVAVPSGEAYVSIAWGLSALLLLALGWRSDVDWVRNTGLATLLVVVAKLFVVDLARLDAVWRILLFLGFGGLLLLLSYFFPKLWKPEKEAVKEDAAEESATMSSSPPA